LPVVAVTPVPTPIDLATAYQIGPEDVLEISVWKNPELSRTVPSGGWQGLAALVNDIQASGLTPIDLRDQVTGSSPITSRRQSVGDRSRRHSRKVRSPAP